MCGAVVPNMWCRGAKNVVPWCQKCGASIFPLLNTNVPSIVVPNMWCPNVWCQLEQPKCVVPVGAAQMCGASWSQ